MRVNRCRKEHQAVKAPAAAAVSDKVDQETVFPETGNFTMK